MEKVLLAAEHFGETPTGRYIQLNSYENRVYEIFCESKDSSLRKSIIKAYRPGRWTEDSILEEHGFLFDLKNNSFPGVTPVIGAHGKSTYFDGEFIFSAFPKIQGRMPDELSKDDLTQIGQRLALLHNIGQSKETLHRPDLDVQWEILDQLENWVAPEVQQRYLSAAETLFELIEVSLEDQPYFRIHGDCHRGNILKTDPKEGNSEYFFVDFDDFLTGPAIQDFWMLMSSQEIEDNQELEALKKGYSRLREFPMGAESLIPLLRALRIIKYSFWISQRWTDPTFPHLFPQFRDYSFWARETEALEKILWIVEK